MFWPGVRFQNNVQLRIHCHRNTKTKAKGETKNRRTLVNFDECVVIFVCFLLFFCFRWAKHEMKLFQYSIVQFDFNLENSHCHYCFRICAACCFVCPLSTTIQFKGFKFRITKKKKRKLNNSCGQITTTVCSQYAKFLNIV